MRQAAARDGRDGVRARGVIFIPDLCGTRQVFLIVLLTELLVLVYTLAVGGLRHYEWDRLARASLFVQWVVLSSCALLCLLRQSFPHLGDRAATLWSLLLVLLVTALSTLGGNWLLPALPPDRAADPWDLLRNLLVALVLAGIGLRYCYLQHQLRQRERSELQARVDALRARIRPHFLFNTLNSIASLIATRPERAERAVEDLAELFRASLREAREPQTVADELRLCELYLGIEQLRLGERLAVAWQVPAALRGAAMPALVLQPLVENAVYHGVARLPGGGEVRVALAAEGDRLTAEVSNPVPDTGHSGGLHMALDNIHQRLRGLYGDSAGLEVDAGASEFRVRLYLPLEPGREEAP